MSPQRENSPKTVRVGRLLRRLGVRFRAALLSAFQEENARGAARAAEDGDRDPIYELPDPPHLEYGAVKYGQGMHDYF